MIVNNFNFANPLWLFGLILIPLGWGWYKYCTGKSQANLGHLNKFIDQNLLPYLLLKKTTPKTLQNYGRVYAALTFCIIMALANPRWSYEDVDAYQANASMVILLDLSASMNATDISPSRIVRARQNVEDLVNLSRGLKIGLVGFAGNAHLISPITDDIQTIRTYIPAIDTDLTNLQGNSLSAAFKMAAELLASEPGERKSILLVSDGNSANRDFSRELHELKSQDIQVHVLGVGTVQGAPYKNNNGSLQKTHGKTVVSKLNSKALQNIAKQGHGIYTEAIYNDNGVRAILRNIQQLDEANKIVAGKVRQWHDKYHWFLLPAALLLLYLFQQRVFYLMLVVIACNFVFISDAMAFSDFFRNSEQKAQRAYMDANFKKAAKLFTNQYNKGVALYRDGDYAAAEQAFKIAQNGKNELAAIYNTGNAQMQQKKWRQAINSYETVLQKEPEHVAAIHNLQIAKAMLEQNPEQENSESRDKDNKEEQQEQQGQQEQNKQNQEQQAAQQSKANEEPKASENDEQLSQNMTQQNTKEQNESSKTKKVQEAELAKSGEERAQQWLSRIDSDIKIFLKNKFYIEDVISAQ